jgi:hypothetical protein
MGSLTESMTRLCREIVGLRGARLTFVHDLGQDVAEMKASLHRDHAEMARRTRAARQTFVKDLGQEVETLLRGFHRAHKSMARKTKAERLAAVKQIKVCVGGMCQEFAQDLAGARRAWSGPSPAERRAKVEAERRAGVEADRRVQEAAERDRLAVLAKAKEEATRHQAAPQVKEETGRPGKKKG